jgi:uncharacterized cupredoxin-like copper-binding protein
MNKTWYWAGIVLALGTSLASPTPASARPGPNVVQVVATEYQFQMPDNLPAGPTLFHLTDKGSQLHHMTIVKLGRGKTLADLTALPPGPFPAWAVFMGGPNSPVPGGGQDEAIVDLTPGHYAVICLIPAPDGKPHMMHGMATALTVTPSHRKRSMPASDLSLRLTNYAFTFSAPPAAGHHVIRVINRSDQPHEAEIFLLAPGKKGADILHWVSTGMQGPPPGMPVAGTSPMAPGKANTLLVDLNRGNYALLCFMPDAKDGAPHAAHGMIYDFTVE